MERYKYRPLLPARHSIRLIQIQPGLPGTDIHCLIIDYTIRDDRASGLFEALSYVWGTTSNPMKIFVADIASAVDSSASKEYLNVTSNLYDALQELRDPDLPRIMWIDAVCINQDDLEERSNQVDFMTQIYSFANQVVIWLGPEDGTKTQELFTAIEDAAELAQQTSGAQQARGNEHSEDYARTDFLGTALESLLSRSWFSRVWVLQEAASARRLLVKCGVFELPGSIFTNGVRYLQAHRIHQNKRAYGLGASVLETMVWCTSATDRPFSKHLTNDVREGRIGRTPSLGDIIERFYLHGVTDRRDTIFALLNLSTSESHGFIKPDYTKSWSAVWTDTIKQILGSQTIVTTCSRRDQACLTVFGYILGTTKLDGDGTLSMNSIYSFEPLAWRADWGPRSWCNSESWCKHIQHDDIVFQIHGAAAPSIIRACGDHFDIIVVAVPAPLNSRFYSAREEEADFEWKELLSSLTYGQTRISLVWDWCADYPVSCAQHPQLFDAVSATPGPHPDYLARMEDSAHIIAILMPVMNHESQQSLKYMLRQSHNPGSSSHLRTKLQTLQILLSSQLYMRLYLWIVKEVEIFRQIFWILCHHTDTVTSREWMFEYHRSERSPYYSIFDVISIVGLEARPQIDGETIDLHFTNAADMHNDKHFADLYENYASIENSGSTSGTERHREARFPNAQRDIRRYLTMKVVRHSGCIPTDIQRSPQSLFVRPLIRFKKVRRDKETYHSLRAFSLMTTCQNVKLTLSLSGGESAITKFHVLSMSSCLFSDPSISVQTAYNIMSAVFNLEPGIVIHFLEKRMERRHDRKMHPDGLVWSILDISNPDPDCKCLVMVFIEYHFEFLMRYVESSEILNIAAATAGDMVLPIFEILFRLDHDLSLSLHDYREQILAQFVAYNNLPPSSDSSGYSLDLTDPLRSVRVGDYVRDSFDHHDP